MKILNLLKSLLRKKNTLIWYDTKTHPVQNMPFYDDFHEHIRSIIYQYENFTDPQATYFLLKNLATILYMAQAHALNETHYQMLLLLLNDMATNPSHPLHEPIQYFKNLFNDQIINQNMKINQTGLYSRNCENKEQIDRYIYLYINK